MEFKDKEDKERMVDLAMLGYVGEKCVHCKKEFKNVKELNEANVKWVSTFPNGKDNPDGTLCCAEHFDDYAKNKGLQVIV